MAKYCEAALSANLNVNFWENLLPLDLETPFIKSAFFLVYQAAQVKAGDKGFLSRDITVHDLLLNRSDVHHVYPKRHLKAAGRHKGEYNQIGNFVLAQSEINIAISDKSPERYFKELVEQVEGGKKRYGGITTLAELRSNLQAHCIPQVMLADDIPDYDSFLLERRKLMAKKIREWFESL